MIEPNNDEVICPNCVTQFRAIPVNVQAELAAASTPSKAAALALVERDAEIERLTVERDVNKRMRDQHFADLNLYKAMRESDDEENSALRAENPRLKHGIELARQFQADAEGERDALRMENQRLRAEIEREQAMHEAWQNEALKQEATLLRAAEEHGKAEYLRGVEAAAELCDRRPKVNMFNYMANPENACYEACAEAIRKLKEKT